MDTAKPNHDSAALRRAAEARLQGRTTPRPPQTEADIRWLQHELEIHQIELEIQNEELSTTNAEIQAELERFTDLYNFAPLAYFNLTEDGTIRLVNLAGAKLVGMERAELMGQPFQLLIPEARQTHFNTFLQQAFAHKTKQTCELMLLKKNEPLRVVHLEATLAPDSQRCRLVILDITERKQAEESFRRIVEFSPNAIVLVNRDGKITMTNAQTEKLFGHPRAELIGQSIEILVPERYRAQHPGHRGGFSASPSARPMGAGRNLVGRHKDGHEIHLEIALNPIDTEEGMLVLATITDITERKQAEEVLLRNSADLAAALARVKLLTGLLPICAGCKKIRDDQGYWNQLEKYIVEHSEATFTHGYCPDCLKKYSVGIETDPTGPTP